MSEIDALIEAYQKRAVKREALKKEKEVKDNIPKD